MLPFWKASRAARKASSSLSARPVPLAVASAAARHRVASLVGILVTTLGLLSSFSHSWRRRIAKSSGLAGSLGLPQKQPVRRIGALVPIAIVHLLQERPENGFLSVRHLHADQHAAEVG